MEKNDKRFYVEMIGDIVNAEQVVMEFALEPHFEAHFTHSPVTIDGYDIADLATLMKGREDYLIDKYSFSRKLTNTFNKLRRKK